MAKTTNMVSIKQGPEGISYIANIGNIIYNTSVYQLSNKVIPIFEHDFFRLPEDKDKYSVVNVYYEIEFGDFIFDQIGIYESRVGFVNAVAKCNVLPIAQFLLKQDLGSFIVEEIRQLTEMSTYSLTDKFEQGITGLQGSQGYPGITGYQGGQGATGREGLTGETGYQGITGVGVQGAQGAQGVTGPSSDFTYLLDIGFESNRKGALDRSPYERDCTFYYTGMGGSVGWVGVDGPVTGIQDSKFIKTIGIIDSAHEVTFAGGMLEYRNGQYLPFSGAISCWLKINQRPRSLFSYRVSDLLVTFQDESRMFPTEWLWDFGDGYTSTQRNPRHTYAVEGDYIVSLKVSNENGESFRYALVHPGETTVEYTIQDSIDSLDILQDSISSVDILQNIIL